MHTAALAFQDNVVKVRYGDPCAKQVPFNKHAKMSSLQDAMELEYCTLAEKEYTPKPRSVYPVAVWEGCTNYKSPQFEDTILRQDDVVTPPYYAGALRLWGYLTTSLDPLEEEYMLLEGSATESMIKDQNFVVVSTPPLLSSPMQQCTKYYVFLESYRGWSILLPLVEQRSSDKPAAVKSDSDLNNSSSLNIENKNINSLKEQEVLAVAKESQTGHIASAGAKADTDGDSQSVVEEEIGVDENDEDSSDSDSESEGSVWYGEDSVESDSDTAGADDPDKQNVLNNKMNEDDLKKKEEEENPRYQKVLQEIANDSSLKKPQKLLQIEKKEEFGGSGISNSNNLNTNDNKKLLQIKKKEEFGGSSSSNSNNLNTGDNKNGDSNKFASDESDNDFLSPELTHARFLPKTEFEAKTAQQDLAYLPESLPLKFTLDYMIHKYNCVVRPTSTLNFHQRTLYSISDGRLILSCSHVCEKPSVPTSKLGRKILMQRLKFRGDNLKIGTQCEEIISEVDVKTLRNLADEMDDELFSEKIMDLHKNKNKKDFNSISVVELLDKRAARKVNPKKKKTDKKPITGASDAPTANLDGGREFWPSTYVNATKKWQVSCKRCSQDIAVVHMNVAGGSEKMLSTKWKNESIAYPRFSSAYNTNSRVIREMSEVDLKNLCYELTSRNKHNAKCDPKELTIKALHMG